VKSIKANRSYKLRLYGTKSKFEDLKWSAYQYTKLTNSFQYTKLTNSFIEHLYFNDNVAHYSTTGLGTLGNQAQQKARGIVKSKKTNEKENNHKKSIPVLGKKICFANIRKQSSSSHFNYKINFGLSFASERSKSRHIFAKGTKPLKEALRKGWKLSNQCEIQYEAKNNSWYVYVFVSKEVQQAVPQSKSIGIDVGIRQIVATSEGFIGNSLSKRLKRLNQTFLKKLNKSRPVKALSDSGIDSKQY